MDRVSIPFNDKPLIQRMERKTKLASTQNEGEGNVPNEVDLGISRQGEQEHHLDHNKEEVQKGFLKGNMGNPGSILKEIGTLKQKMQVISKDFGQLNKTARGERTLGQHIDRLSEVIGNAEEVKNLMKRLPPIESKNRNLELVNKDIQKRIESPEARVSNMEKTIKNLGDKNCNILKTMADNFNTLLNKMDQARGLDFSVVNKDQGPSKHTRANSKKNAGGGVKKLEEMKATIENMNILADQAADLLKTL